MLLHEYHKLWDTPVDGTVADPARSRLPAGDAEKRGHTCQVARMGGDLTTMPGALAMAFDTIDDFVAVQRASGGPSVEAVELLAQAAGVDGEQRALIATRAQALGVAADVLLLGILVARLAR